MICNTEPAILTVRRLVGLLDADTKSAANLKRSETSLVKLASWAEATELKITTAMTDMKCNRIFNSWIVMTREK
jgi:hypothetical protein